MPEHSIPVLRLQRRGAVYSALLFRALHTNNARKAAYTALRHVAPGRTRYALCSGHVSVTGTLETRIFSGVICSRSFGQ